MLVKKFPDALDGQPLETPNDVTDFCNKLIRYGFMYRAQYKPVGLRASQALSFALSPREDDDPCW